jgi:hypothetical protein
MVDGCLRSAVEAMFLKLVTSNIKIDFERAQIPLSGDVLQEGKEWYRDYDLEELKDVKTLLDPYVKILEEDIRQRSESSGEYEIHRRSESIPIDDWPPCMKNILEKAEPGKGPHRACSVLATYLYQIGWSEEDALEIWTPVADRCGIERRIFGQWYGQMCCPKCSTIQETSDGYPNPGIGGWIIANPMMVVTNADGPAIITIGLSRSLKSI